MGRKHRAEAPDADADQQPAPQRQPLPWGIDKTEMQPSSLTALTDEKLARFVIGQQKKTKFQKEREDREAKKRQADAEAAEIYATFVASFDNEDDKLGKAFVRAKGENPTDRSSDDSLYRLKAKEPQAAGNSGPSTTAAFTRPSGNKMSEMDKMLQKMKHNSAGREQDRDDYVASTRPQSRKRRAIDEFLEEMKERGPSEVYPAEEPRVSMKGSFDNGDPETTNLYVGNLAPTVTEEALEAEFGRYGQIYSVKIMWPRSEEERARKRNCGFVSFYERRDADEARVSLDNRELDGQPMIVGWGKAVKIDHSVRAPRILLPATTIAPPVNAAPSLSATSSMKRIKVELPSDSNAKRVIDHLAAFVAADGLQFENAIRDREVSNPAYRFLFESDSVQAVYYRWKVYSLAMGDSEHRWREEPFQMNVDGPLWVPPSVPLHSSPRSRRHRSRSPQGRLRSVDTTDPRDSSRRSHHRSYSRSRSRSSSSSNSSRHRHRRQTRSRSRNRHDSRSRPRRDGHRGRRSRSHSSESSDSSSGSRQRSQRREGGERRRQRRRSRSYSRSRSRSPTDSRGQVDHSTKRSHNRSGSRERSRSFVQHTSVSIQEESLSTGQQIARARDLKKGREPNRLSNEDYDDFQDLLSEMTLERESIKNVMGFALDNSEAAIDIVNVLKEAFHRTDASAVALVGLLFVTSDILHNSSAAVKNASLFRTTFQDCLPEIMDVLRSAHKNIGGRMSANVMKEKVLSVLTAWESWSLFPPGYLVGLNATFMRKVDESVFVAAHEDILDQVRDSDEERLRKTCKQAGILSSGSARNLFARLQWLKEFTSPTLATPEPASVSTNLSTKQTVTVTTKEESTVVRANLPAVQDDVDGEPMDEDNLDGEPMDDSVDETTEANATDREGTKSTDQAVDDVDIDGEPLDEDLDGVPLDAEEANNDEEGDLDGEPMDDEDLDGVPLDEDLDGEPLDEDLDGEPLDEDLDGEPM